MVGARGEVQDLVLPKVVKKRRLQSRERLAFVVGAAIRVPSSRMDFAIATGGSRF